MEDSSRQEKRYRNNVAAVVVNGKGAILACRRIDLPDVWQFPQGGIDPGESAEKALLRELREEIGTDEVEILGRLPEPIIYDWPEAFFSRGYHGQRQTYYLVCLRTGATIDLNGSAEPEFASFEWLKPREFLARLRGFKKPAYEKALRGLSRLFPEQLEI